MEIGEGIALEGDYAILGGFGKVLVFDRSTGAELYKLEQPGLFGYDVDADGDLLIASEWTDTVHLGGSVYVFDIATGVQIERLSCHDGEGGTTLGFSAAISDSHIVAGANFAYGAAMWSGSAYVFERATFQQLTRVLPSDSSAAVWFGHSIAIGGRRLFIGAARDGDYRGSAYGFDISNLNPGSPSCFGRQCPCGMGSVTMGPGISADSCAFFPAAGCITAGRSRTFQLWYRDGGASGCAGTSNTSNAMTILFRP